MGRYTPSASTVELLIESRTKESQVSAQEKEHTRILSRLQNLEVCSATQAIFQRYISGTISLQDLDNTIEEYLRQRGSGTTTSSA